MSGASFGVVPDSVRLDVLVAWVWLPPLSCGPACPLPGGCCTDAAVAAVPCNADTAFLSMQENLTSKHNETGEDQVNSSEE